MKYNNTFAIFYLRIFVIQLHLVSLKYLSWAYPSMNLLVYPQIKFLGPHPDKQFLLRKLCLIVGQACLYTIFLFNRFTSYTFLAFLQHLGDILV